MEEIASNGNVDDYATKPPPITANTDNPLFILDGLVDVRGGRGGHITLLPEPSLANFSVCNTGLSSRILLWKRLVTEVTAWQELFPRREMHALIHDLWQRMAKRPRMTRYGYRMQTTSSTRSYIGSYPVFASALTA